MNRRNIILLIFLLFTKALKAEVFDVSLTEKEGILAITISDSYIRKPLEIISSEQGLIYFETEEGRKWLKGKPENEKEIKNGFHGEWNVEGRTATIKIIEEKGKINDLGGRQFSIIFSADFDKDILGWGFSLVCDVNEYFTGLFERTVDGHQKNSWRKGIEAAMNLYGESVDMIIKLSLSLYCPFYISSRGYGLFTLGTWPGHYDFGKENQKRVKIYFEGNSFKSKLYTADKPATLIKAHSLYVGPTILPPQWAFRPYRWRDNHHNRETYYDGSPVNAPYNSETVEDILMMEALDIPFSVYWVDRPWAIGPYGYNDFVWDLERLPNIVDMLEWIHSKDKKFMLWIAPWVMGDMAKESYEKEYFLPTKYMAEVGIHRSEQINNLKYLKSEVLPDLIKSIWEMELDDFEYIIRTLLGVDVEETDTNRIKKIRNDLIECLKKTDSLEKLQEFLLRMNGRRALVDFSNPEARKWWQDNGPRKLILDGVDAFKLDRSEEIVPEDRKTTNYEGKIAREYRNHYPVDYLKATYDITKKMLGDDFLLMPRAGYAGSSKYAVFWGGDIRSPPEGLRTAIIAVQRSAIIGYPLWGSDIGGYWGGLDREIAGRWLAFGCFCPIMEVGPTRDKGFWDMEWEPHYDTTLIAIWRTYAKIHDKLTDYTYSTAREAHETGMPVVRPLFLIYPNQEDAWKDWQTYLYGSDILVSPIWQKGKLEHSLYLPAGEKWINAWNRKEIIQGGQTVTIKTPWHKIPIFIREGSNVKLGDLNKLYNESLNIARKKPDMKELERKEFSK
jgi:alpha-glucosidase (family GH31 glycosyl hydrolase)